MPTTSGTPRTTSMRRACCAPTGSPASTRLPAASSSCPASSRRGASRPCPSSTSRLRPSRGTPRREVMEELPVHTCINGARSYEFFHSEHRQLAQTMREFHPEPLREGVARRRPRSTAWPTASGSGSRTTRAAAARCVEISAVHSGRLRFVPSTAGGSPRARASAPQPVRTVRVQHQQPHAHLRDGRTAASASPIKCMRLPHLQVPGRRHARRGFRSSERGGCRGD